MTKAVQVKDLRQCVGQTFAFYGVDHNWFKLDDIVWEALGDTQDEYRYDVLEIEPTTRTGLLFFTEPLATVEVVRVIPRLPKKGETRPPHATLIEHTEGYALRDVTDKHIWLVVAVDTLDDYYPMFVFQYEPKQPTTRAAEEQVPSV